MPLPQLIRNFNIIETPIYGQVNPYLVGAKNIPPDRAALKSSALNTPIYTNLIIDKGFYTDINGVRQSWDAIELDNIIITVSQNKRIVITEIQGRDGSVKEYIGLDDYVVNIQGAINGSYNTYPITQTKELKKALSSPNALSFASWWLQNLDINTVVIQSFEFPQTMGEYSTQYFTIQSLSDKDVEALIVGQ